MVVQNKIQPLDDIPPASARRGIPWVPALLLLVAISAGFAWYTQGRAAALEQQLAATTAERDAAAAELARRQTLVDQGSAERAALDARGQELEQELASARAELQRLQMAAAAPAAPVTPPPAPASPIPAAAPPLASPPPAVAESPVEPAPKPAPPPPQALTITFDINSSYFPDSLDGRLRRLASRLKPGQAYAVELTGSVGTDPVTNGAPGDAAAYNRWIAERRMARVADFLQDNAKSADLTIKSAFARNDPSRRVVVKIRPLIP